MTFLEPTESKFAGLPADLREPGIYAVMECPTATTPSPVTNYPQITLSSGLVGVVVDTSIDDTLKGKCMCKAMQHLRASAVAAMLRDPADTSRCLLDYEAASRLTDEDYEAFWKALGYVLAYDDCRVKIEGEMYSPHTDDGGHTVLLLSSSCKSVWDHSSGKEIAPDVLARNGALAVQLGVQL